MFLLTTLLPLHKLAVVFRQKKNGIGIVEKQLIWLASCMNYEMSLSSSVKHLILLMLYELQPMHVFVYPLFSSPFFLCTTCCFFCVTMCHACSKAIAWLRIYKVSEISTIVNFIKLFLQEELDNLASYFPNRFNIYYVLNQVLFLLYGFESNGRFFFFGQFASNGRFVNF